MRLILGGVNGHYLRNVTENSSAETEEVLAAVAYATDSFLFDWCWQHSIPLKFYGRLSADVPVTTTILRSFLNKKSATFTCRLVQHHHAKVIWWRQVGLYIGSANLTNSAWYKNIEAGCFFPEEEITDAMASDITEMFRQLHQHSTPLTEEVIRAFEKRDRALMAADVPSDDFWSSPSLITWPGLVHVPAKKASDQRKQQFLAEWHATLQDIRNIGATISLPQNRPAWVNEGVPAGAQADQFLGAHYYAHTFDGRKANYESHFQANATRPMEALAETVQWWRQLSEPIQHEDIMLNETAPFLRAALSEQGLATMNYETFRDICSKVHAIYDYSRRVSNKAVGLPSNGTRYSMDQKITAHSKRIWEGRTAGGFNVTELLHHVLYDGALDALPDRLWDAIDDPNWKMEGLGISALGELVGWALPDDFPPRNGRTSKALRSLGYDVTVHV